MVYQPPTLERREKRRRLTCWMDGSTGPEVESAKNCSSPRLHHLLLRSLASPKSKVTSHALTARGLWRGPRIYRGRYHAVLKLLEDAFWTKKEGGKKVKISRKKKKMSCGSLFCV
jgi:hypothetical protein